MQKDYIQWALDNSKFPKYDKQTKSELEAAQVDLVKLLENNANLFYTCILNTLHKEDNILDNTPFMVLVIDCIKKHWSTFLSDAKNTPVPYIRCLLLNVINDCLKKKIAYNEILWLGTRHWISYISIGEHEEDIKTLILQAGVYFQEESIKKWGGIVGRKFSLSEEDLQSDMQQSFIDATLDKNETLSKDNATATISNNSLRLWAENFSNLIASGLSYDITNAFEEILEDFNLLNARQNLLWWKESLYSHSLQTSYRNVPPIIAAFAMAKDLSDYVESPFPPRIDALLMETLRVVCVDSSYDYKEEKILKVILKEIEDNEEYLKKSFSKEDESSDRISFWTFLQGFIHKIYKAKDLESKVGITLKNISLGNLCIWIFHDMQVQKVLKNT